MNGHVRKTCVTGLGSLVAVAIALGAHSAGASVWDRDPWGPYGWDAADGRFHQPLLGSAIPAPPAAPAAFGGTDFDGDGVPNAQDNCLLVANPGQQPARRRRGARPIGPADMVRLAVRWKRQNPSARFRTDAELGEACSGYNRNYLRTLRALVRSGNQRKLEIFRFLGRSGPMFGGAANPFPTGKPTSYDRFGTVPGAASPAATKGAALARDSKGRLAKGIMTPSMPMCSGYDQAAGFVRWLTGTDGLTFLDEWQKPLRDGYEGGEAQLGCNSDLALPAEGQAMHHFWAGKRLYTNAEGGRITNRFVASLSESPLHRLLVTREPFKAMAKESGFFPYVDDETAAGQSRHGIIFRGRSYVDGREAILMDWRGFEAAWPLGPGTHVHGALGMLIYDECRAIQTGVYNCTAVTDWIAGERRHTFQEGYMPWVVKGPPSIEEYVAATR
jgi:hypothetical protein